MIYKDRAIRTRKCNQCGRNIEPGEWHGRYQSNSTVTPRNICEFCLTTLAEEVDEANTKATEKTLDKILERR